MSNDRIAAVLQLLTKDEELKIMGAENHEKFRVIECVYSYNKETGKKEVKLLIDKEYPYR